MCTLGILLVRDAILLLGALPADGETYTPASSAGFMRGLILLPPDVKLEFWRRSCDQTLAPLEEFSQKLLGNVKRFREYGSTSAVEVIGSSCIACLAHLAVLYEAVCRTDPVIRGMHGLCDSALRNLGMLTSELELEEYTYLDLLLGVRRHIVSQR